MIDRDIVAAYIMISPEDFADEQQGEKKQEAEGPNRRVDEHREGDATPARPGLSNGRIAQEPQNIVLGVVSRGN